MENLDRAIIPLVCNVYYEVFVRPSDSDSEEDDEEDLIHLHMNRLWSRLQQEREEPHRIKRFVEETILQSNAREFQAHFRVTREVFERVLERIRPLLQNTSGVGKPTIDPQKQLLAVLWLLATPDSYRSVACRFDLGKSSLFQCFERVIKALHSIAPAIISWPQQERARVINGHFTAMAGIPGIVGVVDGTYIPIKAPTINPEAYINRKCFYGITLQGICDHERKFLHVFTGYPSSVSDARIFKNSDIYRDIQENRMNYLMHDNFIIGDKAYPISNWCIPPYIDRGNLLPVHRHFNFIHAKTRQIIERTFALLFGRVRRLRYLDMNRLDLIPATIVAACVLHNVCLSYNDEQLELYEGEGYRYVHGDEEDDLNDREFNARNEGVALRDRLANNLFLRNRHV